MPVRQQLILVSLLIWPTVPSLPSRNRSNSVKSKQLPEMAHSLFNIHSVPPPRLQMAWGGLQNQSRTVKFNIPTITASNGFPGGTQQHQQQQQNKAIPFFGTNAQTKLPSFNFTAGVGGLNNTNTGGLFPKSNGSLHVCDRNETSIYRPSAHCGHVQLPSVQK